VLWLVTSSSLYYPRDGTEDWICLTPDEDKARRAFIEDRGDIVSLIRIEADGSYHLLDTKVVPGP
jgi:hypothetical protein